MEARGVNAAWTQDLTNCSLLPPFRIAGDVQGEPGALLLAEPVAVAKGSGGLASDCSEIGFVNQLRFSKVISTWVDIVW